MAREKTEPFGLIVPEVFTIGNLNVNKENLLAQRTEDVKLVINGISDTAGYKQALALRASYRTVRTTLEKVRKELSAPHQQFVKQLKETTDELGKIAQVAEDYFDTIMTEIDDEKARIAKEKELAEQKRIAGRINELVALGATFDGENYTLPYSEEFMVSSVELHELSDDDFHYAVVDATQLYDTEQQRIADEILKQQEAEEQRLADIETQRIIAETNALEATKLLNKRTALRVKELKLLGFVFKDLEGQDAFQWFNRKGVMHFHLFLKSAETIPDEEWEKIITQVEAYEEPIEPEPTVEENWFEGIGDNADLNEAIAIASGNPVSEPQQSYVVNEVQEEYEPYGDEWVKETMKLTKPTLVDLLKGAYIENKQLREEIGALSARYVFDRN